MIKTKYETKTYTKTEEVMVSEKRYCDVCIKEITGPHWFVTTGHHDWGNDSVDSIEYKDACSIDCLNDIFGKYCEISGRKHHANTNYIEVEHYNTANVQGEVKYD